MVSNATTQPPTLLAALAQPSVAPPDALAAALRVQPPTQPMSAFPATLRPAPESLFMQALGRFAPALYDAALGFRRELASQAETASNFPVVQLIRAIAGDDPTGWIEGPARAMAAPLRKAASKAATKKAVSSIPFSDLLKVPPPKPGSLPPKELLNRSHPESWRRPSWDQPGALSFFSPRMYRETSLENAMPFIDKNTFDDLARQDIFLSNHPDLALGQGSNKGVLLEFDPSEFRGFINDAKPGWDIAYDQGVAEFIGRYNDQGTYQRAVRAITIRNQPHTKWAFLRFQKVVLPELLREGWKKEILEDGSIRLVRPEPKA